MKNFKIKCFCFVLLFFSTNGIAAEFNVATWENFSAAIAEANANSEEDIINIQADSTFLLATSIPVTALSVITINANNSRFQCIDSSSYRAFSINTGNLTLNNAIIENCKTSGLGGAAIIVNGSETILNLNNSIIRNNKSYKSGAQDTDGGGIRNRGGNVTITNSLIENNEAYDGHGGGIANSNCGTVSIVYSSIRANSATPGTVLSASGGGIYNSLTCASNRVTVKNSTISRNTAYWGGGIYNKRSINVVSSTISSNVAINAGGGIYTSQSTSNIGVAPVRSSVRYSTISNNMTHGLFSQDGELVVPIHMEGNIIAHNTDNTKVVDAKSANCMGGNIISDGYNLILDPSDCLDGSSPLIPNVGDQFNLDPSSVSIIGAYLDNNEPGNGFHPLVDNSPALNKGNPNLAAGDDALKGQRGNSILGVRDIGAIEADCSDLKMEPALCPLDDSDGDGVPDSLDNCLNVSNSNQLNADNDSEGNACDADDDNDGVPDTTDNCHFVSNLDQTNSDTDPAGDACDADDDGDGIIDGSDNCPVNANADQVDADGDGLGDVCDSDADGDGTNDSSDNCPDASNPDQADADGDGMGDVCDDPNDGDDDGDGVVDHLDNCSDIANPDQANTDSDGQGNACDTDDDGDGVIDGSDNCLVNANADQVDADGDGLGDACDSDSDGDGINPDADNCPAHNNPDQADRDSDGIGDVCDDKDDSISVDPSTDDNEDTHPSIEETEDLGVFSAFSLDRAEGGAGGCQLGAKNQSNPFHFILLIMFGVISILCLRWLKS